MNDDIIINVKRDTNNSIIDIRSNIFLEDKEGYEEVDRWVEGEDRYLYAHADNGEYVLKKYGKPLYDERGIPNYHGNFVEWNDEEKQALYPQNSNEKQEQEATLQNIMAKAQRTAFLVELTDSEAVKIPYCYDAWKVDVDYKTGDRVQSDGKLWKCKQEHKSQENWKPGIDTASIWEVVDVEHAGTIDDPIPYDMNMEVFKDKYYIEDEVIYKCLEDSGQPLYASCKDLPRYFEKVQKE